MEKTLQQQYVLIKEGKGSKDDFLKSARRIFPDYIAPTTDFKTAVNILKNKSILNEAAGGIITTGRKDWFKIFNTNLKEAVGVKDTKEYGNQNSFDKIDKEVEAALSHQFDNKDTKNIDNVYGQSFLMGYYTEMKDPQNEGKTVDELKQIVLKNMTKDINYYHTEASFGVKGIGYKKDVVGGGEPKAPKGKYKSSGYGDLKENQSTRSVGPIVKPEGFQVGDKVKYKGMNHEVTRIVDDKIYIKNLKYGGRPDTWVKAVDLKKSIKEIGMFHDPIGYKKSEPNPADMVYTKKFVGTSDKKGHPGYIYDIFKNGVKVATIEGEGNANAWINAEKRKLNNDLKENKETYKENTMGGYSNDALRNMIVNLSRYEGNEDEIQIIKTELKKRLSKNHDEKSDTDLKESYETSISKTFKSENEAYSKLKKEEYQELADFFNKEKNTNLPATWFQSAKFSEFPYETMSVIRKFLKTKNYLKENLDINNPVLMKFRASNNPNNITKNQPTPSLPNPNQSKINFLTKERERIMFDMEQEAELEGGPIADMYGDKLDKIDKAIARLRGYGDLKENKPGTQKSYNQEIDWIKYEVDYVPDNKEVYEKWPEPYKSKALKALEYRKRNFRDMSKDKLDSLKETKDTDLKIYQSELNMLNKIKPTGEKQLKRKKELEDKIASLQTNESKLRSAIRNLILEELNEVKRIAVSTEIKEIEKTNEALALEAKIKSIDEAIEKRQAKLNLAESEELAEMIDKNMVKTLQKEIKELEKYKAKASKMYEKMIGSTKKEVIDETLNEGNDFGGAGLLVYGRTKIDNDLIDQVLEEEGYYGIFNARENYWFFPEGEETIDQLENDLENIFIKKGINARFEGQFNETLNEGYGMSLEDAKAEAKKISEEEGVVQHVEETSEDSGKYRVSDWYDSDLTVVSYENGMEL
jgi:hypothetical protein